MNAPAPQKGSVLLVTLAVIIILAMLAGAAARIVVSNRVTLSQGVAWQEALVAAEAGVHQAIAQIQDQLLPQINLSTPPNLSGTQSFSVALSHQGEGNTTARASYVLTGTYCKVSASGTATRLYFSIVSTGTCGISGVPSTMESADAVLRKLTLTGTAPRAARQVEVWLSPVYSTANAITTNGLISLNNNNIVVDSYNSRDPNRSIGLTGTSAGRPGPVNGFFNSAAINNANGGTMMNDAMNASVGTNSNLILAGNSYIYGDAMTNGGVTTNPSHVYGAIKDDFYQPLAPVSAPTGNFQTITVPNKGTTLSGGTKSNPAMYQVSSISLSGANAQLVFASGTASSDMNYIVLYVTGNLSTKGGGNGDGQIFIQNGVQVTLYVGGNIALGGNGISNGNGNASSLSIFGITPTDGSTRTADFGGNSTFYGTVYAPAYDLKLGGTPTYVGSLVGKSATLVGNVSIHYDEALAGAGVVTRYAIASWFENPMKIP